MKRAIYICIAALLVLLVYPSTHPLAKSPGLTVVIGPNGGSPSSGDPPIAQSGDSDDDSDDGDADSITGYKIERKVGTGSSVYQRVPDRSMLMFKMWWNFMIWIR